MVEVLLQGALIRYTSGAKEDNIKRHPKIQHKDMQGNLRNMFSDLGGHSTCSGPMLGTKHKSLQCFSMGRDSLNSRRSARVIQTSGLGILVLTENWKGKGHTLTGEGGDGLHWEGKQSARNHSLCGM